MLTMWDQGRHKKTRLRLLDDCSTLFRIVEEAYMVKSVKFPSKIPDERSVVRGVAMMPGERHDVHRQERTTNRINHTRSLASRRTVVPFYLRRENCLLSYRENRKTRAEKERWSSRAARFEESGGMEWRRGDRKWGKNVPPETKLPRLDVAMDKVGIVS